MGRGRWPLADVLSKLAAPNEIGSELLGYYDIFRSGSHCFILTPTCHGMSEVDQEGKAGRLDLPSIARISVLGVNKVLWDHE